MLRLTSGGAVVDLLPQIGGAVGRFAVDGVEILRPTPDGVRDVLETACFPLVPYANRIANGRFAFRGETVQLSRNFGDHPHALHGHGWQNPWRVVSNSQDRAVLAYEHLADAWPWPYRAEQRVLLTPRAVRLELILSNRGTRAMPASFGFHPYFVRTPGTILKTEVEGVWLSDATFLPTQTAGPSHFLDLCAGAELWAAPFVDHCHFGWSRRATFFRQEHGAFCTLTASPQLSFLHIFNPRDASFFCAEPVSAMPDAVNRDSATGTMAIIEPGETLGGRIELSVCG